MHTAVQACTASGYAGRSEVRGFTTLKHAVLKLQQNKRHTAKHTTVVASAAVVESSPSVQAKHSAEQHAFRGLQLVCPICQTTPLHVTQQPLRSANAAACSTCARRFEAQNDYLDLTLMSGAPQRVYKERRTAGVEIFRRGLVSFAYERGWRQSFAQAGFPGPDREYEMAMQYLSRARGDVLVDMSCGSGLFTRRFAKSGEFSGVVAVDFSESMLRQTRAFVAEDASIDTSKLLLLRADVGRLPFATGSVAALHAGAAIHCWPSPLQAMAEISRVLKPGGVLVASTFMKAHAPLGELFGDEAVNNVANMLPALPGTTSTQYRWWDEPELRELADVCGLVNFRRDRRFRFIMFAADKPAAASTPAV